MRHAHAGSGTGIFQTDTAYRDLDNTYDPGGRLGQVAIGSTGSSDSDGEENTRLQVILLGNSILIGKVLLVGK